MSKGNNVVARALLVKLSISVWDGRRFDRDVTAEVNTSKGATKDAGRYNKHLFGGRKAAPSHSAVISAAQSARVTHYAQTLPWLNEGWQLLCTDNYQAYTDAIREARSVFEDRVQAFLADYLTLKEKAKGLLNGMYRETDYPSTDRLASRFRFDIDFSPIPCGSDFRVTLGDSERADIERQVTERVQRATDEAMRGAWERMAEVVGKVRDKLQDADAIFRDSLIGNVTETVDILSRLNVTGCPNLARMQAEVQADIGGLMPDALRSNKAYRAAAAKRADEIIVKLQGMYGGGND